MREAPAAFGLLCVETIPRNAAPVRQRRQPPSGCCVLKQALIRGGYNVGVPAAFGLLCVETCQRHAEQGIRQPAAFGLLCVETQSVPTDSPSGIPAAFGLLCVETTVALTVCFDK